MILGTPITKNFTTGRLWLQLISAAGTADAFWRDMGNVEDYKNDPKLTRKEHMKSAGGVKQVDLSLVADITNKYSFTHDEFTNDLEAFLLLGTQGGDAVQSGGNVTAEQLTTSSLKGRTYFTAAQGLSAVVVKVGGTTYTLGTDYSLDPGMGAITILPGSAIADASTVTADYTKAAITNHVFTGMANLIQSVNFKLAEYDQFSTNVRKLTTGTGQFYVTNWGDNKDDYTKITSELLVIGQPTIARRAD
jgi:hypothetical protein